MTSTDTLTLQDARRLRADRARQVADALGRQVPYGEPRNGALPPETGLARDFGVRACARRALTSPREAGTPAR
ncbi:hypothetical protein [Spirillospora albida]|uniref:hypothetical protein n=1 Tax=Spirillospora albida TaxID=58123 RepID=UPI0012FA3AA5|nr:hypothetical protein [Spirillospora albida]